MSTEPIVVGLALSYALIGVLLLALLVYGRLSWRIKALAIVVTSAFYLVDFNATRDLLGWASPDRLPRYFKLLQARVLEPHSAPYDPGTIYLWVEELGDDNRPIAPPRAFRLPYNEAMADKAEAAKVAIAAGRPQGGLTDDRGLGNPGQGGDPVKPKVNGEISLDTAGGDAASGGELVNLGPARGDGLSFVPLLPPRMPPKDRPASP